MTSPNLYFLHGFAGEPEDWDGVIAHLPDYECQALSYPFVLPTEGILVGYSMGGRIALESKLPKIIISSNPTILQGGRGDWISKLQTSSLEEFFEAWYAQPLFASLKKSPIFPKVLQCRLKQDRHVLINQLQNHPLKTLLTAAHFIHGALDTKYKALYARLKIPSHEIEEAGHACHLENPHGTAQAIRSFLEIPRDLEAHLM